MVAEAFFIQCRTCSIVDLIETLCLVPPVVLSNHPGQYANHGHTRNVVGGEVVAEGENNDDGRWDIETES